MNKRPAVSVKSESERSISLGKHPQKLNPKIRTPSGVKKVTATLDSETHTRLKIISAQRGRTIEDLLRSAVAEVITRYDEKITGTAS